MKASQFILGTQRENPADAEIISHKMMIRAGLVRQVSSGIYNWLPMGKKVLQKVENIIRTEMDNAGAQEILMPMVQPASLWEDSGRINQYGQELLTFSDRHENKFCLGPTHEEIITDLCKNLLTSYKQLPITLYQIQTKFRDEIRPRFGVMRSREFIMKDAYSFDLDKESLERSYSNMKEAYVRIFDSLGLDYRVVKADSGAIGGSDSEEFHVLADSGEDLLAFSDKSDYAINAELLNELQEGQDPYSLDGKPSPDGKGSLKLNNESILDWTPEKRSLEGIFMSFQYPVVIPGVNNTYFLKAALNAKRKYYGEKELDSAGFLKVIKENLKELDMDTKFLQRPVNQGFSGGEKKRNEILQMLTLEPKLAILDETDSGLDIDALKIIAEGVNNYRSTDRSFLVITHYQRLLKYINPDFIHVLIDGKIVKSGGKELALELEEKGYNWLDS